ncbi:PepSY domain-containing protein [Microbacterium sp. NPDC087665]|uniref:PepSY domain-containing protein n=1 Tax=Microbacterium sp. NPDC087665 TaxID=3364194 RepID=UPI0037FB37E0
MNDKTPNPDQTPESTPDQPTVPLTPAQDAPAQDASAPTACDGQPAAPHNAPATASAAPASAAPTKPGRKRALLIGGGIAAAVVLVGGGVAVGAAIGDEFGDDDDRPSMSDGPRHDDDRGPQQGDDQNDDRGPQQGGGPATGIGSDSADELVEIADAARGAAEGDVTSIDAKRDGAWEVTVETAAGDETEVRVDADLATTVVSTDAADGDDTGPTLTLDEDAIRALVAAALDEAEGMITDLDVDSDEVSPYDVSVLTSDNRSIDIDLDASFAVVGTDIDD